MPHTKNDRTDKLALVIGATGKTGRRVTERLIARGVSTRPVSRSSDIPFDWENEATWKPALEEVTSAYVTYFPDLAVSSAPDAIRRFSLMAVECGVKHLVQVRQGTELMVGAFFLSFFFNPDSVLDRLSNFRDFERLHNIIESTLFDGVFGGVQIGIAGHENDADIRLYFTGSFYEFDTIDARHPDI